MPTGFVHKKFLFPPLDNAGFQDYDGEKLISTLNTRVLKNKKLHGICRFGKERSIMNAQKYTQKSLEAIHSCPVVWRLQHPKSADRAGPPARRAASARRTGPHPASCCKKMGARSQSLAAAVSTRKLHKLAGCHRFRPGSRQRSISPGRWTKYSTAAESARRRR